MWSQLMRRWMELAFWWIPGNRNKSASAPSAQPAAKPAKPADPAASAKPTTQKSKKTSQGGLTTITGIGPAMEKRLVALGITSTAELARANAAELTAKLKADRAVVSEAKVAAWVAAAKNA